MSNVKTITKKQRAVLDDLFAGLDNEQQVLDRHKVSQKVYEKWQTDEVFLREFDLRLKRQRRQSDLIIARYATFAAAKLVQLTESANQETARKACLDIITLLRPPQKQPDSPNDDDSANSPPELAPELAGRLLTALAASDESRDTNDIKEGRRSLL
jgi:hypothetical protein